MPPNQAETENTNPSNLPENSTQSPKLSPYNEFIYSKFKEHVNRLKDIPNVRDKIKYVLDNVENSLVEEKGKDSHQAQKYKDEADKALEKNELKKALILYTEALRYTPHERSESKNIMLSNIYSMRSVVLMKMNKVSSSIKDIDRALKFHPDEENNELNERKEACLNSLKPLLDTAVKMQRGQVLQPPPLPELYEGLSQELSSTSSALCMKESEEKGRYMAALKDIPLGKNDK